MDGGRRGSGPHPALRHDPVVLLGAAGGLFFVVVGYLFGVLLPLGMTFEMLDVPETMLGWLGEHGAAYAAMYYLYLAQQAVLLGAVLAVDRAWRGRPAAGGPDREVATVAGVISVVLAVIGIVALVMAAHGGSSSWAAAGTAEQRLVVVTTYEAAADLGKGTRVVSELFLGWWLGWLGLAGRGAGGGRGWLLLVVLGGWTAFVGLGKLVDPLMPLEDWLAFVVSVGLVGAGVGLRRLRAAGGVG